MIATNAKSISKLTPQLTPNAESKTKNKRERKKKAFFKVYGCVVNARAKTATCGDSVDNKTEPKK